MTAVGLAQGPTAGGYIPFIKVLADFALAIFTDFETALAVWTEGPDGKGVGIGIDLVQTILIAGHGFGAIKKETVNRGAVYLDVHHFAADEQAPGGQGIKSVGTPFWNGRAGIRSDAAAPAGSVRPRGVGAGLEPEKTDDSLYQKR